MAAASAVISAGGSASSRSFAVSSVGFSFTPLRARGRPVFVTGRFLVGMPGF